MGSIKQWMLGAAVVAGSLGLSAAPAQAARVGIYVGVGGPEAYVPPYPGPGYAWVGGYWANGYWVPGYWNFVGVGPRVVVRGGSGWDRGPTYYRHDFDRRDRDDRHDFDRHDRDHRHFDRDNRFRR